MNSTNSISIHDDIVTTVEESVIALEDLLAISIEEVGNGSGRAIAVLLSAQMFVKKLRKAIDDETRT